MSIVRERRSSSHEQQMPSMRFRGAYGQILYLSNKKERLDHSRLKKHTQGEPEQDHQDQDDDDADEPDEQENNDEIKMMKKLSLTPRTMTTT
eukprot:4266195-Amphidinium_carterae.1